MSVSDVRQELDKIKALALQYKGRLYHPLLFVQLNKKFQGKYGKVSDMLMNHAVLRYEFQPSGRIVWIVKGRERDYLVYPDAPYCHCTSFYMHIIGGKGKVCSHLAAQKLALVLNMQQTIVERDELFNSLMKEWILNA